jgi:hypothetical protein
MRSLRRPTRSTIHYHGRTADLGTYSVTLSINGIRWAYTLTPQQVDTCEYLAKHVSVGKALAHAKSHASRAERIDPLPSTTLFLRHRGAQASRQRKMKVTLPNV